MTSRAVDALDVFWDGEQVPGLLFYGLRRPLGESPPGFPEAVWSNRAEGDVWRLHGDGWEVIVWTAKVNEWPEADRFRAIVRCTLAALLDAGCVVAWVGREGFFSDPPDLFLPEFMTQGVLAALSEGTGFRIAVDLDQPVRYLLDDELLELREAGAGLADAS